MLPVPGHSKKQSLSVLVSSSPDEDFPWIFLLSIAIIYAPPEPSTTFWRHRGKPQKKNHNQTKPIKNHYEILQVALTAKLKSGSKHGTKPQSSAGLWGPQGWGRPSVFPVRSFLTDEWTLYCVCKFRSL